jgi:hypothetical protein
VRVPLVFTLGKLAAGHKLTACLPKYCRGVLWRVVRAPERLAPGIRGRPESVFYGAHVYYARTRFTLVQAK